MTRMYLYIYYSTRPILMFIHKKAHKRWALFTSSCENTNKNNYYEQKKQSPLNTIFFMKYYIFFNQTKPLLQIMKWVTDNVRNG